MTERLFCHCGPFFPSDAPNNPKNQNLKKWRKKKKMHEILSFYTCIPQMTIIWYIVPEIWSATDRILSHFGPFFALLPHNNTEKQNLKIIKKSLEISFYTSEPKIMIICYTVPAIWWVKIVIVIFHSGLFFALLPSKSPKNQIFL